MGETLRMAVGIMGNGASLLLYAAPVLTFRRVLKRKSIEEFSCIPYIMALLNCLLYTWYGLPVVSEGWENVPVVTINGVGVILEASFVTIYLRFASSNKKMQNLGFVTLVLVVFGATTSISSFSLHNHHKRMAFVGSVGLVASVSMYSSPLIAMKQVLKSKSVEFMPFNLSFFSFLASSLWMAYGLLSHDIFLAAPNLVGSPMGLLQLTLYFVYRNSSRTRPEIKSNGDMEKNPQEITVVANI